MSEPIKDNAHILANQRAFDEACARAREVFGKIEGVASIGFGQKQTAGQYVNDIAIAVFVWEKKKPEELTPEQRIPAIFEGYKTDVTEVPLAAPLACDNNKKYDTIVGGIQIQPTLKSLPTKISFGTLGCIVRRRGDAGRENVYLLTCKHVLFTPESGVNDCAFQPIAPPPPGTHDLPGAERTALGPIQEAPPIDNLNGYSYTVVDPVTHQATAKQDDFFIDCAIARINIDSKCGSSTCTKDEIKYDTTITDLQLSQKNDITDVRSVISSTEIINKPVYKVGRTTGKTAGFVRSVNGTVKVLSDPQNPNSPLLVYKNMIQIDFDPASGSNCKGHQWFAEPGDSGSIVVDDQRRAIGLLAIGPPEKINGQPTPNAYPTFACHILPVLDSLKICIPTSSGTSYGSSLATDGSGLKPAAVSAAEVESPSGEIVFAAQHAETLPAPSAGLTEPVPVTDDEVRHMRELLAAFRNTRTGRELHEVFADVRREMGYLVRNCRPVKVAWHRNKGPAFLAHLLNHLKGHTDHLPREVDGVSRASLLTRMSAAFRAHGSNPLRQAIEKHSDDLLSMLTSGNDTAQDWIAYLEQKETA
jgi:hypothetical protein